MKKIGIIVILVLQFGCEIVKSDYYTYSIVNDSNYDIIIEAYDQFNLVGNQTPSLLEKIEIKSGDTYSVLRYRDTYGLGASYFQEATEADSVIIIFGNERSITYICTNAAPNTCTDERNILNWRDNSDEVSCEKNRGCDYYYYLTIDDYATAVSLK